MSGGGGGGGSTVAPTYTDPVNGMTFTDFTGGSDALNAEIAARQATDLATSNAGIAQATQQNTANEASFQTALTNAQNNATTGANQYFTQQGYDPSQFSTLLSQAILADTQSVGDPYANWVAGIPGTATTPATGTSAAVTGTGGTQGSAGGTPGIDGSNPSAAFSPNLGANIVQEVTTGDQNKAVQAIDSLFSPTYAADNITNDWLAPAASSAISSQFDPLTSQLTNALKRGTLNQQGYDAATTALSKDQTAAQSTVNNLGSNIIANDQTGLNNYITGAKNDAANVNISDYGAFNPNTYQTGASKLVAQDQSNFAGDLTNAIGSTSFADLPTLLNIGGAVQGATDPTATNPAGVAGAVPGGGAGGSVSDAYIAQQALANQQRGLGSTGAF